MVWLTWRQHRWAVGVTAVIAVVAALLLTLIDLLDFPASVTAFYAQLVQAAFPIAVGMFWGAPLVAREFEERTFVVAWGQDVTPVRWLAGKVVLLGGVAVLVALLLGIGDGYRGSQAPSWRLFEVHPLVQVGYVLFAFALGVATGAVSRHTVTAMGATFVGFVGVRTALALWGRDLYWPAEHVTSPFNGSTPFPPGARVVELGYYDAHGDRMDVPAACEQFPNPNNCLQSHGAVGRYYDYLPNEWVLWFQLAESAVCLLLAAGLFFVAFRRLPRGWRPSRAHLALG